MSTAIFPGQPPCTYPDPVEQALTELAALVPVRPGQSPRTIALLLLQGDHEILAQVTSAAGADAPKIVAILARAQGALSRPLTTEIALARQQAAEELLQGVLDQGAARSQHTFAQTLGTLAMRPLTGIPIALGILWVCFQFVGVFGAGELVDLLEARLFGEIVNPWLVATGASLLGLGAIEVGADAVATGGIGNAIAAAFLNLVLGENGIITLGITYAVAIILPIVFTFFLFFSILEDTGYFPRLALLVDRIFKFMGLNGRAVIPIVLGFGCDTMATMVTRIQESQRERLITTFLLALAVPCSAQLGVILALLGAAGWAAGVSATLFWSWVGFVAVALLGFGWLASKVMPGEAASFYMEVPPLRLPVLRNILVKTFSRMQWYTLEIIPLFIWASIIIWALALLGLLDFILVGLNPLANFIGLPGGESGTAGAKVILQGFFRRDYGAAGLYEFASTGALTAAQIFTACVVFTLFIPCIAQFMVMKKEFGLKRTFAMLGIILVIAFGTGGIVHQVLKGVPSLSQPVTLSIEEE